MQSLTYLLKCGTVNLGTQSSTFSSPLSQHALLMVARSIYESCSRVPLRRLLHIAGPVLLGANPTLPARQAVAQGLQIANYPQLQDLLMPSGLELPMHCAQQQAAANTSWLGAIPWQQHAATPLLRLQHVERPGQQLLVVFRHGRKHAASRCHCSRHGRLRPQHRVRQGLGQGLGQQHDLGSAAQVVPSSRPRSGDGSSRRRAAQDVQGPLGWSIGSRAGAGQRHGGWGAPPTSNNCSCCRCISSHSGCEHGCCRCRCHAAAILAHHASPLCPWPLREGEEGVKRREEAKVALPIEWGPKRVPCFVHLRPPTRPSPAPA
jgi:hypothetical protein